MNNAISRLVINLFSFACYTSLLAVGSIGFAMLLNIHVEVENMNAILAYAFGFSLFYPCILILDALVALAFYRFGTERTKWLFLFPLKAMEAVVVVGFSFLFDWVVDGVAFATVFHILFGFLFFLSLEIQEARKKKKESFEENKSKTKEKTL